MIPDIFPPMYAINIAVCVAMLVVASLMDIRRREVSDWVWVIAGAVGIGVMVIGVAYIPVLPVQSDESVIKYITSICITAPLAYIAYRWGLFGGADAKALVVISILVPSYQMQYSIHGIPALTVLTNASLLTIVNLLHNVARNSLAMLRGKDLFDGMDEPLHRKMLAFMLGFVTRPKGYMFALEEVRDGRRVLSLSPKAYSDFAGHDGEIWVTQALPFIIYITIGFVIMLCAGDLLAYLFHSLPV
ncbi:MAG: prepilin peptidase [Candidatus Nitrosocaldus sp.]|nr:prepilin peptidase [Candidatus Nitrosocaldus sp.]MDW8274966.1 prepilin peptidase [Candidatus Nitrosocaldus sp.]